MSCLSNQPRKRQSKMRKNKYFLAALSAALLLSSCADSNDIAGNGNSGRTGSNGIRFSVDLGQDWQGEGAPARAALAKSQPRNLQMTSSSGLQAWLQETTLTGIAERPSASAATEATEVSDEATRAALVTTTSAMSDFSTFCNKQGGTVYYSNVKSSNTGVLEEEKLWDDDNPMSFFAVHPYASSGFTHNGSGVSLNFSVNSSVAAQQDLMYAATGSIGQPYRASVPLSFRHALTAVSFAFGSNPDFDKTISAITLKNVYTSGTYTLPSGSTSGSTGTWSNLAGKTDITLSGLSVPANMGAANTAITSADQNFLMIPQDLSDVQIVITFSDNSTMTSALTSGTWTQGTTKVYKLSLKPDTWTYQLTLNATASDTNRGFSDDYPLAYTATTTGNYSITSYRYVEDKNKQQAVPWKVTKYEEWDAANSEWDDRGTTKPAWLTALSLGESGLGGTSAASGNATVDAASYIIDKKAARDNTLKNATAKSDYDLSQGGETANCYVISSPGTYKIPLIYGNARNSSGAANTVCFNTNPFCDYKGAKLTQKEIKEVTASTTAALVWKDVATDIVTDLAVDVANNFLTFTVPQAAIQQGNAVVGIKNGNDYLWSWHLWFAPESALATIAINNYQNQTQNFTTENLGFAWDTWEGSTYDVPRKVRITVQQTEGNDGAPLQTAQFTIVQTPGAVGTFHDTKYQFGRKDAFSGKDDTSKPNIVDGNQTYATAIKNPGTFYTYGGSDFLTNLYNAWAAGNSTASSVATNAITKTVYDPCPVGFKMPGSNAFTGFSKSNGTWNTPSYGGYNFTVGGNTIFFPAAGYRGNTNGTLDGVGAYGYVWSAVSGSSIGGWGLGFYSGGVDPQSNYFRANGFSVRPVQENN